jgi:hypothetical protein
MSKKQEFIDYVEEYLFKDVERVDIPDNVWNYWEAFKGQEEVEKPMFTDNGKLILKYMQDTVSEVPMQKAKDIGEGLFISSRAVSGAIRKLVTDGYVEKVGQDPVIYTLTELGKSVEIV